VCVRRVSWAAGLLLIAFCGCKCPVHSVRVPGSLPTSSEPIKLYDHPLDIRLSSTWQQANSDYLIIYATGDGGWHGIGAQLFEWVLDAGFPVAGFSSKGYLKNMGYVSETTTPERLVMDYELIIEFAENRLHLSPSTRIILVGVSRGAGLSVVAAGEGTLQRRLAGVVAVALTKEEEYVRHYRTHRRSDGTQHRELVEIKTYQYLNRLVGFPVSVIQSTGDNYITAADARDLFGPDTELRKLRPITARNHKFSGGCDDLYGQIRSSLDWVRELASKNPPGDGVQTRAVDGN
jgi:hypothetical protein